MFSKKTLAKAGAVLAALVIWQLAAMAIGEKLILVTPIDVAVRLATLITEPDFLKSVLFSLSRIVLGFITGVVLASLLAVLASRVKVIETLLWPWMSVIKSVPVASFIILVLIWLGSSNLSVFIAFLMVLPIVYSNVLQGLKSTDIKLLEMASVFHMGFLKRLKYIHLPALKPHIISAISVAAGLAWKAGIAAEVIGIPDGSIGEKLYEAKVYLSSPDLFAWTVVIIVLSVICEKLLLLIIKLCYRRLEKI
ncbi:MAG: ABC transporter permease subunit [Parasporobacterium sp.]|nr:ABC transporter permease subunit [Parasporobacterium sp.]